jgi:hypothetical protein
MLLSISASGSFWRSSLEISIDLMLCWKVLLAISEKCSPVLSRVTLDTGSRRYQASAGYIESRIEYVQWTPSLKMYIYHTWFQSLNKGSKVRSISYHRSPFLLPTYLANEWLESINVVLMLSMIPLPEPIHVELQFDIVPM